MSLISGICSDRPARSSWLMQTASAHNILASLGERSLFSKPNRLVISFKVLPCILLRADEWFCPSHMIERHRLAMGITIGNVEIFGSSRQVPRYQFKNPERIRARERLILVSSCVKPELFLRWSGPFVSLVSCWTLFTMIWCVSTMPCGEDTVPGQIAATATKF